MWGGGEGVFEEEDEEGLFEEEDGRRGCLKRRRRRKKEASVHTAVVPLAWPAIRHYNHHLPKTFIC